MFCSLCAADNPNDGHFCVKCGAVLQGQRGTAPPVPSFETSTTPYTGSTETSGKAIGSLICGIVFFFFPSAIAAIILGHLALGDIRKSGGRLTGGGMATAGLVLGYVGMSVIPIMIVAAIAIPNLLRARIAANEASAVGSVRTIETAAFSYGVTYSNGFPPSLESLDGSGSGPASCGHAQLLDGSLAPNQLPPDDRFSILVTPQKSGYIFNYVPTMPPNGEQAALSSEAARRGCTVPGAAGFEVHADPVTRGTTGQRSLYGDQTGVIRFNVEGPATSDSPPLE
jgi:type IV pilus assembly protein PilA